MPVKYKDKTPEQKAKYREYQREYKKRNAEKFSEYKKNWHETHRKEIREYQKQWRANHPNYQKQWREKQKPVTEEKPLTVPERHDICPACGSSQVGKIGRSTYYCRECAAEFTDKAVYEITRQGIRIRR